MNILCHGFICLDFQYRGVPYIGTEVGQVVEDSPAARALSQVIK